MPPSRKPLVVQVPSDVADEIADAARRTHRSVGFIVRRALGAGASSQLVPNGERAPLTIAVDEDDPADTLSKIKACGSSERSLDDAVAAAWTATRARFQAWIAREESAAQAERADDLDTALADAASATTSTERLSELAASEYPKVRALVAIHPKCPAQVLTKLSADKEPYVRDAVENRRLRG